MVCEFGAEDAMQGCIRFAGGQDDIQEVLVSREDRKSVATVGANMDAVLDEALY